MSKFVTKVVKVISAKQIVEELFIDGVGQLEAFETSLKGTTYESEYKTTLRYIEHFANGNSVGAKVVYLKGVKDGFTEYEFRGKHVRIYAIQLSAKKVICLGGLKAAADSSDNIARFRLIKTEYLREINLKK